MSIEANASADPGRANKPRRRKKKYLKIHYTYVRLLLSVFFTFVLILAVSLYHLNQYQISMQANQLEYDKLLNDYRELETQASELLDKLNIVETKNDSILYTNNQQANRLNEVNVKYAQDLDEVEKKTEELQQKLDDLEKAKEEIINQLRKIPYLPGISNLAVEPIPMAVSYSSEPMQMLSYKLDAIDNIANAELSSYQALADTFWEVKPVLDNYPSMWPVKGKVTSGWGERQRPMGGNSWENHTGLDIAVPVYSEVLATGGGIVTAAGYSGGYGYLVVIDHGMGLESYYAHNYELSVSVGDKVARGQVVAKSGNTGYSTGPHVHYEVRVNGRAVNPINYVTLSE